MIGDKKRKRLNGGTKYIQTDASRAKAFELRIQERVTDELRRLEEHESKRLQEREDQIASSMLSNSGAIKPVTDSASSSESEPSSAYPLSTEPSLDSNQAEQQSGREPVQRQISLLRERLERLNRVRDVDPPVSKAREDVVRCLQTHEKRPLDCWREVESFKREVARLEKAFVDRVL